MTDDIELLRRYAEERSEAAFAELVTRHLGLVYAIALRQLAGDTHRAQDVTQQVFVALARKARPLSRRTSLGGWLYLSTHHAATALKRAEARRQKREEEASIMQASEGTASDMDWSRLRPALDVAICRLPERDREAVVLRFYQGCSFVELGVRMHSSSDAARVRVNRALEKMRAHLARDGLTSTTAALALALSHQANAEVPANLASAVTGAALSGAIGTASSFGFFQALTMKQVLKTSIAVAVIGGGAIGLFSLQRSNTERRERVAFERVSNHRIRAHLADPDRLAALRAQDEERTTLRAKSAFTGREVSPEVASERAVRAKRYRSTLDQRYAALFRSLRLTPERLENFKDLLVERELDAADARKTARAQGVVLNDEAHAKLKAAAVINNDEDMLALLGRAGFERLQRYELTLPFRTRLSLLIATLQLTATPLTDAQVEQLVELTAAQYPTPGKIFDPFWGLPTDTVVAQAQMLLHPQQLAALKQHVEAQRAWARMAEINRAAAEKGLLRLTPQSARDYPGSPTTTAP